MKIVTENTCSGKIITNLKMDLRKQKLEDIKSKFKLLPHPQNTKLIKNINEISNNVNNSEIQKNHVLKSPRNLLFMAGKIEFCLNSHKLYPSHDILFGVYGNILKITKGKYKLQHLILLRNETGPVLQVTVYKLPFSCTEGQKVYCVGRFIGQSNHMQIYKIKDILEIPSDEIFNRIRNVCNFSLKKIK